MTPDLRYDPNYQQGLRDGMKIALILLGFWALMGWFFFTVL